MGIGRDTPTSIDFMWKSFLAGGVAGMCSKTVVAPLDRIKILLQAHSEHYKNCGVFSGLGRIIARENFLALYKGNGAQMVRIFPYAAVQFSAYEVYKKYLPRFFGKYSHVAKFLSGSCAGVTAVCLTYPLDMIRARLAFQVTGEHVYRGIAHVAASIFKNEGGLRALYRGFLPTVCGMIPYAGSSFYGFEMFKYCCMKYIPHLTCTEHSRNTGGLALNVPGKLVCGGLAGAVAQSMSYPLDVTRRRMQLAMMNPETRKFAVGMFKTLVLIYKENGIVRGLYRGMSINYLRAMPMVAASFSTYELMKQLLDMDTGLAFYGLKEWKGLRLISQYPFLDSVPNSLEGRWWEVLKQSCHFYLTHFGEGNLVKAWLLESQNVTALLCRNDGLFRDCLNIDQGVLTIKFPQTFLFPSNYVRITYPCP